tara:strand:- start:1033 stop:1707 length:675 start_codon:yes stop_codon:yes gene_type:complete
MELDLKHINEGFENSDANKIYTELKIYFENNKEKIRFQKHPLGFKYFKLGSISATEELRLHLWTKTNENHDNDLQVHDHSFNFKSFVIFGLLINHIYKSNYDKDAVGLIYDVKFRNERSRLILNSSKQKLIDLKSEKLSTGNFYEIQSNEFHKTENLVEPSLTILKITKPKSKVARVYSPKKLSKLSKFERTFLSENDNNNLINEVVELIKLGTSTVANNVYKK